MSRILNKQMRNFPNLTILGPDFVNPDGGRDPRMSSVFYKYRRRRIDDTLFLVEIITVQAPVQPNSQLFFVPFRPRAFLKKKKNNKMQTTQQNVVVRLRHRNADRIT